MEETQEKVDDKKAKVKTITLVLDDAVMQKIKIYDMKYQWIILQMLMVKCIDKKEFDIHTIDIRNIKNDGTKIKIEPTEYIDNGISNIPKEFRNYIINTGVKNMIEKNEIEKIVKSLGI